MSRVYSVTWEIRPGEGPRPSAERQDAAWLEVGDTHSTKEEVPVRIDLVPSLLSQAD